MFHHLSIGTLNYDKSVEFYTTTLELLFPGEIKCLKGEYPPAIIENDIKFSGIRCANIMHKLGSKDCTGLSIMDCRFGLHNEVLDNPTIRDVGSSKGCHIAFAAKSEETVNAWYHKAIELGATCNGKPGRRDQYGDYYGAFVIDHDGYRIEACVKDYTH